jgi:hypothetical protein
MFGVEYLSCALPLDFIRWTPSLNHGHETSWRWECLFFDGWLPWLGVLDHGGLMTLLALLYHICRRVGRWWWSIESYRTCHRLFGLHPLLKRSTEAKEISALNEEMSGSSYPIFIEVRVSCAPPPSSISSADSCG